MIPNSANIPPPPSAPQAATNTNAPDTGTSKTTNEASAAATQELFRQSIEAKDNAMKLITSVQNVVGIAESAVREQMAARPYLTMGAAAGVGYVLAGGLASSMSRHLVRAGTKAATAFVAGVVLKKVKDAAEGAAVEDLPTPAE